MLIALCSLRTGRLGKVIEVRYVPDGHEDPLSFFTEKERKGFLLMKINDAELESEMVLRNERIRSLPYKEREELQGPEGPDDKIYRTSNQSTVEADLSKFTAKQRADLLNRDTATAIVEADDTILKKPAVRNTIKGVI